MALKSLLESAEENQEIEDRRESDKHKLGEGANTTAHKSDRGYVVKEVKFNQAEADNPLKPDEDPADHIERVKDIERFPWAELEKLDRKGSGDYARIRMDSHYLSHSETEELYTFQDLIREDLDLFFDLREENITYRDFKPDNIGYFPVEAESRDILCAKPIDITDGARKPWKEEDNISERELNRILELYVKGTPDEDGLVDKYAISAPEACQHISDYIEANTEYKIDLDMNTSDYSSI
jgi:hypothetical protein